MVTHSCPQNLKKCEARTMKHKSFAIFILTHGRADNVITYETLKKAGCTAKIYFVIDNEDDQAEKYYKNFGKKNVIMFDKLAVSKTFDTMDLSEERRTIVYARNACFDIAKNLGVEYFLELDDDYTDFQYRYLSEDGEKLLITSAKQFDKICDLMLDFLDATKADSVALAQGGDFIGGKNGDIFKQRVKRKAMNSFFCRTDKRFDFIGRINEDVNTYCYLGSQGKLFLTIADVMLTQVTTQKNNGGMTDVYLDSGTYLKTIYTVILCPSFVKISCMGMTHRRIHHRINWNKGVPLILHERWKK